MIATSAFEVAGIVIGAVAALATVVSVFFAWKAASAARDAVREARLARADEERRAFVAALERVADLVAQAHEAWADSLRSDPNAITRNRHARNRLRAAIAATGLGLPACLHIADSEGQPGPQPFDNALNEIRDAIAAYHGEA
jgi:hypothetical protein